MWKTEGIIFISNGINVGIQVLNILSVLTSKFSGLTKIINMFHTVILYELFMN